MTPAATSAVLRIDKQSNAPPFCALTMLSQTACLGTINRAAATAHRLAVLGWQLCRLAALTFVNFCLDSFGTYRGLSSFNRRAAAVLLAELSPTEPALSGAYGLLYSPPRRTHPLGTRRFYLEDCKIDTKPASQR